MKIYINSTNFDSSYKLNITAEEHYRHFPITQWLSTNIDSMVWPPAENCVINGTTWKIGIEFTFTECVFGNDDLTALYYIVFSSTVAPSKITEFCLRFT